MSYIWSQTSQEEFVENHRELLQLPEVGQFNHYLVDYLLFYNTQRPHHSLSLQEPMRVVVNYLQETIKRNKQPRESKMLWTDTVS